MNWDGFDEQALGLALQKAAEALDKGNYPVGAVLAFDQKIVAQRGNTGAETGSLVNHAENLLIIEHGKMIYDAFKEGKTISVYTTLEPCLMCLGSMVINKIHRIVYMSKDLHAGAGEIMVKSLGRRYWEVWPQIIQNEFSLESRELIKKFLEREIARGNDKWAKVLMKRIIDQEAS